jgi:hypothetical protein
MTVGSRPERECVRMSPVFTVHATRKLLTRLGSLQPASAEPDDPASRSTTALGNWYATTLPWRRQVALFVNETTLLPVLTPLAPAATLLTRFPDALASVLSAHGAGESFIAHEREHTHEYQLAKTANRSVVGIMTEFSYLAAAGRELLTQHGCAVVDPHGARCPRRPRAIRNRWPPIACPDPPRYRRPAVRK